MDGSDGGEGTRTVHELLNVRERVNDLELLKQKLGHDGCEIAWRCLESLRDLLRLLSPLRT